VDPGVAAGVEKALRDPVEVPVKVAEGLAVLEELIVETGLIEGLTDGVLSAVHELVVDTDPVILGVSEELGVSEGLGVPVLNAVTEVVPVPLLELVFVGVAGRLGVFVTIAVRLVVTEELAVPVIVFIGVLAAVGVPVTY